jgi:hypothetical protein
LTIKFTRRWKLRFQLSALCCQPSATASNIPSKSPCSVLFIANAAHTAREAFAARASRALHTNRRHSIFSALQYYPMLFSYQTSSEPSF